MNLTAHDDRDQRSIVRRLVISPQPCRFRTKRLKFRGDLRKEIMTYAEGRVPPSRGSWTHFCHSPNGLLVLPAKPYEVPRDLGYTPRAMLMMNLRIREADRVPSPLVLFQCDWTQLDEEERLTEAAARLVRTVSLTTPRSVATI